MVEEEPAQPLGFREHIVGGLTAMTRALVMVVLPLSSMSLVLQLPLCPNGQEDPWTA